jgi:hypothetical protein
MLLIAIALLWQGGEGVYLKRIASGDWRMVNKG